MNIVKTAARIADTSMTFMVGARPTGSLDGSPEKF
jgi:hypothetical protein